MLLFFVSPYTGYREYMYDDSSSSNNNNNNIYNIYK